MASARLDLLRRGDNGRVFPTDLEARISQPFPVILDSAQRVLDRIFGGC